MEAQNHTYADTAMSLGLNPNILSRWIREVTEKDDSAFRGNGKLTAEQTEIRQLREEVRRLKMEKEILKKATADSTDYHNTTLNLSAGDKKLNVFLGLSFNSLAIWSKSI